MNNKYPDCFVVGAQKSGTTFLYGLLKKHSSVFVPEQKETHFFITNGKPLSYSDTAAERLNKTSVYLEEEYLKLFLNAKDKLKCEVCPTYLYDNGAASKIFDANPNAKIVVILRDPIERAFSAYKHMKSRGAEKSTCFKLALENEKYYIENNWQTMSYYLSGSRYFEQVKRYFDIFPRENILILNFEELKSRPIDKVNSLLIWLGIPKFSDNVKTAQTNKTYLVENKIVSNLLIKQPKYIRALKKLLPKTKRALLKERVLDFFKSKEESLTPNDIEYLKLELKEDVQKLRDLTGMKFDNWQL